MDLVYCKERLCTAGVVFDPGLTSDEISSIEDEYKFRFPPDLREFLGFALPVSKGWVDWRQSSRDEITKRMEWPFEGMCFDIENNSFWLESFGAKPEALDEAFAIARKAIARAPRLIPVYGHRYLPDSPCEVGNPVFSVYQTDIIYYGTDLFDYLCNEFGYYFDRPDYIFRGDARYINFWSDLVG